MRTCGCTTWFQPWLAIFRQHASAMPGAASMMLAACVRPPSRWDYGIRTSIDERVFANRKRRLPCVICIREFLEPTLFFVDLSSICQMGSLEY
jgi:hypothetical protein